MENIKELLEKAKYTRDQDELRNLSKIPNVNVRCEVALNSFTPRDVINKLADDPVANVVFIALKNHNCTNKKERYFFKSIEQKCLDCKIPEIEKLEKCQFCDK